LRGLCHQDEPEEATVTTTKKSLNVALGEELITYIDEQLKSGLFNNQSEVVRDALRQHRQGQGLAESLRRLNEMVEAGNEQIRQGKVVSQDASQRRIEAILQSAEADESNAAGQPTAPKRAAPARRDGNAAQSRRERGQAAR